MENLLDQLDQLSDPRRRCFLCGADLALCGCTAEHVVPQWAQRRYGLWDQSVTLLNQTEIRYSQLTVPCCPTCNSTHLKSVEDSLSQTVDHGRNAVASLSPKVLFVWLGKIFYGLLYKELMLMRDRADPKSGTIITAEFLQEYCTHRLFLQQARGTVMMDDFDPGSLFVFECQQVNDRRRIWDLIDYPAGLAIAVRVGRVGIMAALGDGGAQQLVFEDHFKRYYGLPLHPLQFKELFARLAYRTSLATRTPKYVIVEARAATKVIQMPLGGFSMKPFFEDEVPEDYARLLSFYLEVPLEDVYRAPNLVRTLLHQTHDGDPYYMDYAKLPP